jgi:hypothetical protein
MPEQPKTDKYAALTGKVTDLDQYVHQAYDKQIDWYWEASSKNKKSFKQFRTWTVVLGALVTLIASLSTTKVISDIPIVAPFFTLLTPVLAATLTIINSLSQNFQWGATWRDMVVSATRLQKEKNRFLATPPKQRKHKEELVLLNEIILDETEAFFQRILDSNVIPTEINNKQVEIEPEVPAKMGPSEVPAG